MADTTPKSYDRYPFTDRIHHRDYDSISAWARREQIECLNRGIPFAAQGRYWLYYYNTNAQQSVSIDTLLARAYWRGIQEEQKGEQP